MVNEEVILRKVTKLKEYVNELRQAKDISWKNIKRIFATVLLLNGTFISLSKLFLILPIT